MLTLDMTLRLFLMS